MKLKYDKPLSNFCFQLQPAPLHLVPALRVLQKRLKCSDEVAGATLLAAGKGPFRRIFSFFQLTVSEFLRVDTLLSLT